MFIQHIHLQRLEAFLNVLNQLIKLKLKKVLINNINILKRCKQIIKFITINYFGFLH